MLRDMFQVSDGTARGELYYERRGRMDLRFGITRVKKTASQYRHEKDQRRNTPG